MNTVENFISRKGSTLFLRAVIIIGGLLVLAFCIFAVPAMSQGIALEYETVRLPWWYIFVGMYGAAIPFYLVLYETMKLLSYIDKNEAFSYRSVKALRKIKHYSFAVGILAYAGVLPLFYVIAQSADAPGAMMIGLIITSAPHVIAVFAAVLEKLLRNAIAMQEENALTV